MRSIKGSIMKKLLIVLTIGTMAMSCVSMQPVTTTDRLRVYNENYDTVFDAIKSFAFENNLEIMSASKDSGVITARLKADTEIATLLLVGVARVAYTNYSFSFMSDEDNVKVMAKIYTAYADGSYPFESVKMYTDTWNQIDIKLN